MNKTVIKNYQIISIVFTFILGSLLHFTYNISSQNSTVAFFSSINESVWEHLKLVFFPMAITTIIGSFYFIKNAPNFLCSKTIGLLTSMCFTIIFFYTYTGVLGNNIAFIDISSFFIATLLGEYVGYKLILSKFNCNNKVSIIVLLALFISFLVFTYFTPNIGIFKDPITGQYGIIKKYLT